MKLSRSIWTSIAYLAMAAVSAQAEILYTQIKVAIPLNGSPYNLDLDDGVTDFVLQSKLLQTYCQSGDGYLWTVTANPTRAGNGVVAFASSFGWFDRALSTGIRVGSDQTFYKGFAAMSVLQWGYCGTGTYGQWLNIPDRHLALQFQIVRNGIPETHYGWAKVSVAGYLDQNGDLQCVTVLSGFAYETVPGMEITTGQLSSLEQENP